MKATCAAKGEPITGLVRAGEFFIGRAEGKGFRGQVMSVEQLDGRSWVRATLWSWTTDKPFACRVFPFEDVTAWDLYKGSDGWVEDCREIMSANAAKMKQAS